MVFRLPQIEDEAMLFDYVQEHCKNSETSIAASRALTSQPFSDWVSRMHRNAQEGDETFGKSLMLLCMEKNRLIGLLSNRYDLPKELTKKIGDIGYGVCPSERRKGYATNMLRHALGVCRDMGKREVVVGCYKDNFASTKTILKCGGVFLNETAHENGKASRYYVFSLQRLP